MATNKKKHTNYTNYQFIILAINLDVSKLVWLILTTSDYLRHKRGNNPWHWCLQEIYCHYIKHHVEFVLSVLVDKMGSGVPLGDLVKII